MPNQGNKSNGKSGIGQPKRRSSHKASVPSANQKQSNKKQEDSSKENKDSLSSSSSKGG
jgi:hypothetical protein